MGRRRDTVIEIDVADYLDGFDEALDEHDAVYVRNCLEDARGCLNRPERSTPEAIEFIERALGVVNTGLRRIGSAEGR